MHLLPYPIILLGYILTLVTCNTSPYLQNFHNRMESLAASGGGGGGGSNGLADSADNDQLDNLDKRPDRYAFGLGRRAYTYTSSGPGVKRLPVYNFGLGKRATWENQPKPYAFGLGKRANDDEYAESDIVYDLWPVQEKQHDSMDAGSEKRARPYSFGLGKRQQTYNDDKDRRSPQRYNFGLGKR